MDAQQHEPLEESPKSRHRRPRYSLRLLLLVVALVAIGAALWSYRSLWWKYQLMHAVDPKPAWANLLAVEGRKYNGNPITVYKSTGEAGIFDFVWVKEGGSLICIGPRGEIVPGSIVANGEPSVIWNGRLPDRSPGLILYADNRWESYALFLSVDKEMIFRWLVQLRERDVKATFVSDEQHPAIELVTADKAESRLIPLVGEFPRNQDFPSRKSDAPTAGDSGP